MKFIFADCLDYVDPNYDFENDISSQERKPYWDDQYPHEILDQTPYDGILVSRAIVERDYSETQAMRFRRVGAREFLRFNRPKDKDRWIFGDCGAFQYVNLPEPPYSPTDVAEFYSDGGFTHGCSIDHIIFHFDPKLSGIDLPSDSETAENCKKRFEITLENARLFLIESRQICRNFTPLGVVQGWSPGSMAHAASELIKMGYKYLAIGGLVPLSTTDIHLALRAIFDKISYSPEANIHLLGFEKADALDEFIDKYPITSIDTTSPLTKAFKSDKKNYYLNNNKGGIDYYTAIRIPQAFENLSLKRGVQSGLIKQDILLDLENKALSSLRQYAKYQMSIDETLEHVLNYSKIFYIAKKYSEQKICNTIKSLETEYLRTLTDRPWDKCKCKICRDCSIEVLIFRASNRNKRRGFHNIKAFYDHLQVKRGNN